MAKILIADDSSIMRRNLKLILKDAGHSIVGEASNGKQAILGYQETKPDLITMDITMPIMDGIEATKRIIDDYPHAKIVMISALDQRRKVYEALNNGAKHYIIKPITKDNVLKIVDEVLIASDTNNITDTLENQHNKEEIIEPFTIENDKGTFIINIMENLDENNFVSLNMAIKGFLYIKPLKIVFNLNNIKQLNAAILSKLDEITNTVKEAGGEINVVCDNKNLIKFAKSRGSKLF